MIIFPPRLENYQFSQPRSIFLIYDSTIYVFSIYHGDSPHYSCLSWFSQVLSWGSEVSCQHSYGKAQGIWFGSNRGPLGYESNTLPLSHTGPGGFQGPEFNPFPKQPKFRLFQIQRLHTTISNLMKMAESALNG